MTDLSIRPSVTHPVDEAAHREEASLPLLVGLSEMLASRDDIIGARAARLSLATRSGLPIPPGSVLTAAALGCIDDDSRARTRSSAEAVEDTFDHLGRGGRIPLMVSVSAVSRPRSAADRIVASHAVTSRSDLLHTVRRLSATATVLGETIAVVVQRDIDDTASGTLIASPDATRVADSIETETTLTVGDRARFVELGRRVSDIFGRERLLQWSIDRSDQLWILDIATATPRPKSAPSSMTPAFQAPTKTGHES